MSRIRKEEYYKQQLLFQKKAPNNIFIVEVKITYLNFSLS